MGGRDPDVDRTRAALKAMRQRAKLSQRQLSQAIKAAGGEVSSNTLAQIETGRRLMSSEVATKAAPALGTDALSLLVASNAAAIKSRIDHGEEGPDRARRLLVEIRGILEEGGLTSGQERALLDSAEDLANLLESLKGAGETPEDRLERLERASATKQKSRRARGGTISNEASTKATASEQQTVYGMTGRDVFGRRR